MKKILFILTLLASLTGYSQNIPNHSGVSGGYYYRDRVVVEKGFTIPAGTTPALSTLQYSRSGALFYDTVGTDTGLYIYHNPYWVKLGGGASNVANGLYNDAGTLKWGGTLVENTIISGAGAAYSILWDSLDYFQMYAGADFSSGNGSFFEVGQQSAVLTNTSGDGSRLAVLNTEVISDSVSQISLLVQTEGRSDQIIVGFDDNTKRGIHFFTHDSLYVEYNASAPSTSSLTGFRLQARRESTGALVDFTGSLTPTLQQVFDVESANAVTNKDDTISTGSNRFIINGSSGSAFRVYRGAILGLNVANNEADLMVGASNGLDQNATTSSLSNGAVSLTGTTGGVSLSGTTANNSQFIVRDSISVRPYLGIINIDSLATTVDTAFKMMLWKPSTGEVRYATTNGQIVSGGSSTWNGITNPTGDQALTFDAGESSTWTNSNTAEDLFTVNTSTLTTGSIFSLNSTSTALASGNNLAEFVMSGANGSSSITATGIRSVVTNTGTSSINRAIYAEASGASVNYAIEANGRIAANGYTVAAGGTDATLMIKSIDNSIGAISIANTANYSTFMGIGPAQIQSNSSDFRITSTGGAIKVNATNVLVGGTGTPHTNLQSNGSFAAGYVEKTTTYSASSSDFTINCTSGTFTVTLPTAVGITGRIYNIANSGAGTITVGTTSSQTFVNVVATPTTLTLAAVGSVTVQSTGANWVVLKP